MEQPTINIGLLGHVANGKSSLVRAITGEKTARGDSRCMQKGESREMTIQVGYSNAKIYQCNCPRPDCYVSTNGANKTAPTCDTCKTEMELIRHVSFVDNPGHRSLMTNMLSGSMVIDTAILVVDANKDCPQIQTLEHLMAAEIIGIDHYTAIAQNKIDLCRQNLEKNYKQILDFVKGTSAENTPIIPTSMSPISQINLKYILAAIVDRSVRVPNPIYNDYPVFIHCVRSFDINKPCTVDKLRGGVIGGTIMVGTLRIGDIIEVRGAGLQLQTRVVSLYTGTTPLQEAHPGGLIGIGTTLDPSITRADRLVGACAGLPGTLPAPQKVIEMQVKLLSRGIGHDQERSERVRLAVGDPVQIAVGSQTTRGKVVARDKRTVTVECDTPVHPINGQTIPISKYLTGSWTIIGRGLFGTAVDTKSPTPTPFEWDYQSLVPTITVQKEETKLLAPKVTKDGGAKLVWENFDQTCKDLGRDPTHLSNFFAEELACQTSINIVGQLIIHGKNKYTERHIQKILVEYVKSFVQCGTCKSLSTKLEKRNKHLLCICAGCGAERLC